MSAIVKSGLGPADFWNVWACPEDRLQCLLAFINKEMTSTNIPKVYRLSKTMLPGVSGYTDSYFGKVLLVDGRVVPTRDYKKNYKQYQFELGLREHVNGVLAAQAQRLDEEFIKNWVPGVYRFKDLFIIELYARNKWTVRTRDHWHTHRWNAKQYYANSFTPEILVTKIKEQRWDPTNNMDEWNEFVDSMRRK